MLIASTVKQKSPDWNNIYISILFQHLICYPNTLAQTQCMNAKKSFNQNFYNSNLMLYDVFCQNQGFCSYKIVLIKKSVTQVEHWNAILLNHGRWKSYSSCWTSE